MSRLRTPLQSVLIPLALSMLLLACGGQASSVEASMAAPATAASTPRVEATASPAAQPASAPAASPAPAPLLAQAASRQRPAEIPGLTLGQDYEIIEGGQRFSQGNTVEVAEVFAYWCGGCAHIAPLIEGWKPRLPAGVNFTYVPLVGNPQDQFPRAFYAAEATGITGQVHAAVFRAIHVERSLRPNASAADIAGFFARLSGGNAQELQSTMESFAVNANLGRARQFSIRNGVTHTPMLIIDGQYRVNGQNHQDQLRIADQIIRHLLGKTA